MGLRFLLAPVLLILLGTEDPRLGFGICLVIALVSDICDGMIARKLGVATSTLRRLDSLADSVFYITASYCIWILSPDVLTERRMILWFLAALEIARYVFDLYKFKKEASYHMWSSKVWGLLLFSAFLSVLAFRENCWLVDVTIYWGMLADLEGLGISWVLPRWQSDVPSFIHALRIRR